MPEHTGPWMTLRRVATTLGILASIGVLSACVGIPSNGAVVAGPAIDSGVSGDFDFLPEGPVAGAKPDKILQGFIAAFTGPQNDYKVAREFLTTKFAGKWEPRNSVLIRSGGFSYGTVDATTMTYSFNTLAAVDASGSYSASTSPSSQTLTYTFVKEGKQWRISDAPAGIVLSQGTFATIFTPQTLYFLDPSLERLVPDRRWFPSGTAPTRIVNALLAGPPPWLQQGATTTAFPDGAQLTSPKVVLVSSGVAKIDLSGEALSAKDTQRQLMRVQLVASLSGVSSIRSVAITVNGSPYPISDADTSLPEVRPQVDTRPVVLRDGQFGYYANGKVSVLDKLSAAVVAVKPLAVTLGVGAASAAVLGDGGVFVVHAGDDKATLLDGRPGLAPPSLDAYGYVWSVPTDAPGAVQVFGVDGKAHDVASGLPSDARLVSLDVSRDGTRVAILLATDSGPRLLVTAILRDPDQKYLPTALGDPVLDVTVPAGKAIGATWMDELTVATLTGSADATTVTSYGVGGMQDSLGRTADAIAIVGGNGTDTLRIIGANHIVQVPTGSSWSSTGLAADLVATQQ